MGCKNKKGKMAGLDKKGVFRGKYSEMRWGKQLQGVFKGAHMKKAKWDQVTHEGRNEKGRVDIKDIDRNNGFEGEVEWRNRATVTA